MEETVLLSYLKGETSKAESQEVEAWTEADAGNLKVLEQLYYVTFLGDRLKATEQVDVEGALARFKSDLKRKNLKLDKKPPFWRKYAAAAAAFIIGILFAGILFSTSSSHQSDYTFLTGKGERAQVLLPDGTKVWLNSSTYINFHSSFFGLNRGLELSGEAYFEVAHDQYRPFVVSTNQVKTTVLGTKFNVRFRKEENRVVTSLLSGSVKVDVQNVAKENQEFILKPGQEIAVNTKTMQSELTKSIRPEDILLWIDGKLNFKNATLLDITRALEKHFDVRFSFQNEALEDKRFTCEFETDDDISQILKILSLTNQLKYQQDGRNIRLFD
ncbi:DUF4974 domain-containing protein [Pedobacter gandavensis]|uniref:FecR family protein n=1 Tax=Pedobacter gandavensis TaxID=2679963 RepID=UPI00247B0C3E|nr:FecR domain-containing protein [Pedobacter gandavensis]WGQ11563.1 DUF4974 domain-containing protein [Pedobacter gandavensis]